MDKTNISVYLAIPMPSIEMVEAKEDVNGSRTALYDMIDELCMLSGEIELILSEYGMCSPRIELLKLTRQNKTLLKKWFLSDLTKECEFVSFSAELQIPDEQKEIYRALACVYFRKQVSDILIASNLCRVGSIELRDSAVVQDGALLSYSHLPKMNAWPLQRAVELSESIKWPQLHILPFQQVWKWINTQDYLEGFEGGSLGRALCAFSRLFENGQKDEAMQIVWALIGIEALYVKGKNSIMEQVREKIQVFLGQQQSHKKTIVEMYEFRSRFLHGDLDFPPLFLVGDARDCVEKHYDNESRAVEISIAILIATLQQMIIKDWTSLDFAYTAIKPGD
jgi:hypothetical protein